MRPSLQIDLAPLAPYLLRRPPEPERLDWREVFGRTAPVEVEIGCGKGQWLVDAAAANPERDFAGVEIKNRQRLYVAERLARRGLANARIACDDGWTFLRDAVPPGSLAAVHLYFPDPWWKPRHRDRRIWTPRTFAAAAGALRAGGSLFIASDVEAVFAGMMASAAAVPALIPADPEHDAPPASPGATPSNFERKAAEGARSVRRAVFRRG